MKKKNDNSFDLEPLIDKENILTTEELIFCEYVASGHTRREAYKKAYPKRANWKDTSLDPEISRLYKEQKILNCISIKSDEFAKIHFMGKNYKRAELKAVWEDSSLSMKDRLRALDMDAKLAGDYAPTKVENSGAMNLNHSVDHTISEALDSLFN